MMNESKVRSFFLNQPYCNHINLERYINFIKNATPAEGDITQTHHIIPRHMGGTDDEDNLVLLNVKQHIHAHKILYYTIKTTGSYYSVQVFNTSFVSVHTDIRKKTRVNISRSQMREFQKSLTKKTKWMTKDGVDTRVKRECLDEYILNGWEFGRSSSSVKGFSMYYDSHLEKNVRIKKEEMESNPSRYHKVIHIPAWDTTNQPDFPYIHLTGVTKKEFESGEYETKGSLVYLSDGSYIHESYFDPDIHEKMKTQPLGGRSSGLYITPYGNFQSCHNAESVIPELSRETIIKWCKNNNKKITSKSFKNDFHFRGIPKKDLIGMTPRELGFSFIPKEECTMLSDGSLIPPEEGI